MNIVAFYDRSTNPSNMRYQLLLALIPCSQNCKARDARESQLRAKRER